MKDINGTVTLAYVEEDNKQRVIFRVIPLCTREGVSFHDASEDFPDEGSLRIVPDKREQSTFKERMRDISGLCAIHLVNDGAKELIKVRQNRNYAPDAGEKNKLAIYSDVVCEFAEDGCFEVVQPGQDASGALTRKVIIQKDKVLYGPVLKEEAASVSLDSLHPFGNDRFLLQNIQNDLLGSRMIYWDPEAIINWRQRRNAMRRKERAEEKAELDAAMLTASAPAVEETQPDTKPQQTVVREKTVEPRKRAEKNEKAEKKETPDKTEKTEKDRVTENTALPIGTKLDILDQQLTFDQQISRLDQGIGSTANRLTMDETPSEEEEPEIISHFNGTPLVPSAKPITKSAARPESMHHVVEQQLFQNNEGENRSIYRMVENPIDSLNRCLDYVWQNADMRSQAIEKLSENETFMRDMLQIFRRRGLNTQASAAAQEQLAEIEAERLSLLMQLDSAKQNAKQYREEAIASLSQKLRAESEKLKNEIQSLEKTKKKLTDETQVLSQQNARQTIDFFSQNMQCMSGAGEERIMLSPVIGCHYEASELAEKLRVHMNESGYGINEDDAMGLLIYFSVNDTLCLCAATEADAARFAQVMLESFGLQSVSGTILPESYVEVVSILPEDGQRTPTVTIQSLGTESMSIYGHKTLYLATSHQIENYSTAGLPAHPIVHVPTAIKRAFGRVEDFQAVQPASLSSFMDIRSDTHPMLSEADKWFAELKARIEKEEFAVPRATLIDMRRFIEVATRKVRGGFLAAADSAVCHWLVPAIRLGQIKPEHFASIVAGLPRAMRLLHMDHDER
ncbi:MAG: hypothetical protein PUJ39_03430 [Eubacteriales bacterium]|nr:hypothetical protein [Eubacteriales bacterium]